MFVRLPTELAVATPRRSVALPIRPSMTDAGGQSNDRVYRSKRASSTWIEGSFVTSADFGGSSEPSGACSAHRMR